MQCEPLPLQLQLPHHSAPVSALFRTPADLLRNSRLCVFTTPSKHLLLDDDAVLRCPTVMEMNPNA